MADYVFPAMVKKACAYGMVINRLSRDALGKMQVGTSQSLIDNGYIAKATAIGQMRIAKIIDPPASLLMLGRVLAPSGQYAALYLHPLNAGRDILYVPGMEDAQPLAVPFFTVEPTGYQAIGSVVEQNFPDQGLADWRTNSINYGGFVPSLGAVSTSFLYHLSTPAGQSRPYTDYAEIRIQLVAQGLNLVQYTATGFVAQAVTGTSVRIANSAVLQATGLPLFYPFGGPIDHLNYIEGWATAAPLPSTDGSFTFVLASTLAAQTPGLANGNTEPWSFAWLSNGKSNLTNGAQVSGGTVVRDWVMDAVLANAANTGLIWGYGANNMFGGQWVVASGKAYTLLCDASNWTSRPDITAPLPGDGSDVTFNSPYATRLYTLDPAGAVSHIDVAAGIYANPSTIIGTANTDLVDTAFPFIIGGCTSGTDVYFVAFNAGLSVVSAAFVPRVTIFKLDTLAGTVSTVLTHEGVYHAACMSVSGYKCSQVAWIGNGKLAFICTQHVTDTFQAIPATVYEVDAVLGIFDTANGSLKFSTKMPEQVWRDMSSRYLTEPGDNGDNSGKSPFAGALDCIVQEQAAADGTVASKAQILFSAGGLGTGGSSPNNTGWTYITRDTGKTWVKIASVGSGVATVYAGNQVQFRSGRKDL